MPIDWDKLDWGTSEDFEGPGFVRDETLDLSVLDFKHYIWLYINGDDGITAIGDEEGFWKMCEEEQDYYTPDELLRKMEIQNGYHRVPRNFAGYAALWE